MNCKVELDDILGSYEPGQTVKGKIIYFVSSMESIKAIGCQLIGIENTTWAAYETIKHPQTGSSLEGTVQYKGENIFLSLHKPLSNGDISVNDSGRFYTPFAFNLPLRIPSTYHNKYGHIRYYVRGFMDQGVHNIFEDECPVVVQALINFNYIKSLLQMDPIVYQNEVVAECCCPSNPVVIDMILEKEAYIVGENFQVKLDVNNQSSNNISEVLLTLSLVVETKSITPKITPKYTEKLLAQAKGDGLAKKKRFTYRFSQFHVPEREEIPNLDGSKLFRMKFVLKAKAIILDSNKECEVEANVQIGHIPLMDFEPRITTEAPRRVTIPPPASRPIGFRFPAATAPTEEFIPSAPGDMLDGPDILPPSYDEVMRAVASEKSQDTSNQKSE